MNRLLLAAILGGLPFTLRTSSGEQSSTAVEERIKNLNKQFGELKVVTPGEKELIAACAANCTLQVQEELRIFALQREAAGDNIVSQIHREVDAYLVRTLDPKQQIDLERKSAEQDLSHILPKIDGGSPSVFALDSEKDRSLIVAFLLHKGTQMGTGSTSMAIWAYRLANGGVALSDSTGNDLDGYGRVSIKELHSPISGEVWFLTWGYMTGANGPNVRMRVYAYDGTKFRTIWMPENVWGTFDVQVTADGFTIDGNYYRQNKERHDKYLLSRDGIYLVFPGK